MYNKLTKEHRYHSIRNSNYILIITSVTDVETVLLLLERAGDYRVTKMSSEDSRPWVETYKKTYCTVVLRLNNCT
jgi:hypothetical protein